MKEFSDFDSAEVVRSIFVAVMGMIVIILFSQAQNNW